MATNQPVARVSAIQGKVFAKGEDGAMRQLNVGDPVFEGEVLVALPGSQVELATEDGRQLTLRENEVLTLDAEVVGDTKADAADSALLAVGDDTNRIIQAINEGGSLDELLEETAAGEAAGGSDGGSTFVRLLRITEGVGTQDYDFATSDREQDYLGDTGGLGVSENGSDTVAVDTAAPEPTITLDRDITADDLINASEAGQTIAITGTVGGDAQAGDLVTLTVNGKDFIGTVAADQSFSILVPGADLAADGDRTIDARVTTSDGAGNVGTASTSEGYSVDLGIPTVVVDILDPALNVADKTSQVSFSFSEAPVGFTAADLSVVGGTLSGLTQIDATHWSATFTADDNYTGAASVTVAAGSYTNAAGNAGTGGSDTVAVDTAAPEPTITLDRDITADDLINASEAGQTIAITGTVGGDAQAGDLVTLTVNGKDFIGTVAADQSFSILVPGADLAADGDRTIDARVTTSDGAGNVGTASTSEGYSVDLGIPTVVVDILDPALNVADKTSQVSFSFSEAPVGFTAADLSVVGGTLSGLTQIDATHWSATFTADDNYTGAASVTVAAGSYTNAAGNAGTGGSDTVAVDTAAPEPTITLDRDITADDLINASEAGQTIAITGTVGGDAQAGDLVTLTVNGKDFIGTVAADQSFSILVPGADLAADGDRTIDARVTTSDGAGNVGTASTSEGYSVDLGIPTVVVDILDPALNVADKTSQVSFSFSEAPVGFTAADLSVVGGTLSGLTQIDATHWSATFTADDNYTGAASVTVAAGSYTNAAGNAGTGGSDTVAVDTAAPEPTITLDRDITADDLINASEAGQTIAITGTVGGDAQAGDLVTLTVNGKDFIGTVAADQSFSILVPGADLAADGDRTIDARVTTSDGAGNVGTASTSEGYSVDLGIPTVVVDILDPALNVADKTSQVSFSFSEAPVGFTAADLSVVGGTLSGLTQIDATHWSATFTADDNYTGAASVTVAAGSYTNAAGNAGTGGSDTVAVDTAAPEPTITLDRDITADDLINASEAGQTIAITGTVGGDAQAGDLVTLTVNGKDFIGTVAADQSFSIQVPGADLAADGDRTIDARVTTSDGAGNVGTASTSEGYSVDLGIPTVVVDILDPALNVADKTSQVSFSFSEAPVGFSAADLSVVGGTLSGLTQIDATHWSATFTADDNYTGAASVTVAAGSYTNAAGNAGTGGSDTVAVDTAAPEPTITLDRDITADDLINASEAGQTIAITGTVGGDAQAGDLVTLTVNGKDFIGTVAADQSFSILVPGADLAADGDRTIDARVTTSDGAGNVGTASTSEGYSVDLGIPTVVVDILDPALNVADKTSQVSFSFSEAPVGFTAADLSVVGGTLSGLTQIDATHWSATFTADDNYTGAASVTVAAGSYTNAAGNAGTGGSDTVAVDTAAPEPTITLDRDITADDLINASEAGQTIAITGTVGGDAQAGDLVTLTVNGKDFIGTVAADQSFSILVPGADLAADGDRTIDARVTTSDGAGNVGTASTSEGYSVDTRAPTVFNDTNSISEDASQPLSVSATSGVLSNDVGDPAAVGAVGTSASGLSGSSVGSDIVGEYGTLHLNSDGSYTYALDTTKTQSLKAGQVVNDVFYYNGQDAAGNPSNTGTLTIAINGTNDVPTIGGTSQGSAVEAGGVANGTPGSANASGQLLIDDADTGESSFQAPANLAGTYGTFSFNAATGEWHYQLDDNRVATQALTAGQIVHDTLTVTSLDGTATKMIDVTVTGANDVATITGTATGSLTEDANLTAGNLIATGKLAVADIDSGEAVFQTPTTLAGAYGTFTLNTTTGDWTYTASNAQNAIQALGVGQTLTDSLVVKSADGTASQTITVTINGTNDAPVATGGVVAGIEDTPQVLTWAQFKVTDVDGGSSQGVVITSLPINGVLQYSTNGVTWTSMTTAGQTILKSNIDQGYLRFVPAANESGADAYGGSGVGNQQASYATFGYQPVDGSSVNGTGNQATMVIDITPVADAPTLNLTLGSAAFTQTSSASGVASGYDTYAVGLASALVDTDGSESLSSIRLTGVPSGATFSAGTKQADGSWVVTAGQLAGLTMRVPTGTASFDLVATVTSSETSSSSVATTSVTVNVNTDHGTIAVADSVTAVEAGGASNATAGTNPVGNVLTNDLTIDAGDTKRVSAVSFGGTTGTVGSALTGAYGTLILNADGSYSYVVDNSNRTVQALRTSTDTLTETFTYTTTDGGGTGSSSTTLTVTIQGANDAPVAVADTDVVTWPRGGTGTVSTSAVNGVLANDSDVDSGDTERVSAITKGSATQTIASGGSTTIAGTYGSLTIYSDGHYTYTTTGTRPGTDAQDVFTYTVRDTAGLTSQATLTINVDLANAPPTASSGAVTGLEDTPLVFTWANFNVSDADGVSSSLGINIRSLPTDGVLQTSTDGVTWTTVTVTDTTVLKSTIDAGLFRFVPDANESGSNAYTTTGTGNMRTDYASFTYRGTDGAANSGIVSMRVDITPVADDAKITVGGVSVIDGTVKINTPPDSEGLTVRQYTSIGNIDTTKVDTAAEVQSLLTLLDANTPGSTGISTSPQNYNSTNGSTPSGISTDGAYRITGLVYLEAGHSYTFSSYMDDTALLVIGGTVVLAKNFNSWGNITATTYQPTVSGYYTLDWAVYNGDSIGALKPYLSVDGATALELTTSNFKLYSSVGSLESLGGADVHEGFISVSGSGGYYPVADSSVEDTTIKLSPIVVSLSDGDGSETLVSILAQDLLVGTTLTDGKNSFTATAGSTSVNVTGWTLTSLSLTPPTNFFGSYSLNLVATTRETATGETATNSTVIAIPVIGVPDAPTAVVDTASLTEDSGNYLASGSVLGNDSDPDGDAIRVTAVNNQTALLGVDVAGSYGYFHVNADGSYTYSLLSDNARVNSLNGGQSLIDSIVYTVTDATGLSSSAALTVTIHGATDGYSVSSTITGTNSADDLVGTAIADNISGLAGNDYVEAGAGDDVVRAGDAAGVASQSELASSAFMVNADASMTDTAGLLTTVDATHRGYGDLVNGGDGNDALIGTGTGSHLLYGGAGDDYLLGGSGSDALRGGAGSDRIEGGAGSDVMRGDLGADVFAWSLGDGSTTAGTSLASDGNLYGVGTGVHLAGTTDLVTDFSKADGDVLDLRDLLVGEQHLGLNPGNLEQYLHFEVSNGNTVVHVSTTGGFAGGNYDPTHEDQTIVLQNVNLLNDGTAALLNDNAVIQDLLKNNRLIVD